jgi:hypothetical protein
VDAESVGGRAHVLQALARNRHLAAVDELYQMLKGRSGTDVMIFKIFSPKKLAKIMALFCSTYS